MSKDQNKMKEWLKRDFLIRNEEKIPKIVGGVFSKKARERLLEKVRPYGGRYANNKKSTFWGRVTDYVEGALIDLELFIVFSPTEKVNKTITFDSVKPIIDSYFQFGEFSEINFEKIKLAEYCIFAGFEYMRRHAQVSRRDTELIEDAIEVSQGLGREVEYKLMKMEDSI